MYTRHSDAGSSRKRFRNSSNRRTQTKHRGRFLGNRGNRPKRRGHGQYIDPKLFVSKAVITEELEHFVPEHSFSDFAISPDLKNTIVRRGYTAPTPIQDRAIPHILHEADVVGIANTGTGKTAAFLIPLINKVLDNRNERVLIIVPTRELALQISDELKEFSRNLKINYACCFGGSPIYRQMKDLRNNVNFVIGTPGRLKDLLNRKVLNLALFKTLVLDEADRMLDMGFINDIRTVVTLMPPLRHTLFFSATLSPTIEKLIGEFLREPVRISVKMQDTSKNVDQDIVRIGNGQSKFEVLRNLLAQPEFSKILVFSRTKYGAEKLSRALHKDGVKAESIHGNKTQSNRQRSLKQFKEGKIQTLIATDVAARGLDIDSVSHVINYDIPATYEDYVHRIGRTGRGNKKGKALTFID